MKKLYLVIFALTVALVSLVGCGSGGPTVYEELNELVSGVDGYQLSVSSTTEGETLTSSYDVDYISNGYTVAYTYDWLNHIDVNNPTDGYKSVKSGTATVVNGQVESYEGDEINVLPNEIAFKFDKSYFTSAQIHSGSFKATVENASGFLNKTVETDTMSVEVLYTETAFTKITLSYATNGTNVTVVYQFN